MMVDKLRVGELHPTVQVLMDAVLANRATFPFEGKVCTQKQPSPSPAIDAKYQWPILPPSASHW